MKSTRKQSGNHRLDVRQHQRYSRRSLVLAPMTWPVAVFTGADFDVGVLKAAAPRCLAVTL